MMKKWTYLSLACLGIAVLVAVGQKHLQIDPTHINGWLQQPAIAGLLKNLGVGPQPPSSSSSTGASSSSGSSDTCQSCSCRVSLGVSYCILADSLLGHLAAVLTLDRLLRRTLLKPRRRGLPVS